MNKIDGKSKFIVDSDDFELEEELDMDCELVAVVEVPVVVDEEIRFV